MLATTSVGLLSFITHVILVKYEMYLCLSIFHYLDKNLGWVTDGNDYEDFPEDY